MNVNIALLTVTDTRTFDNDKSGAILVEKIKEANSSKENAKAESFIESFFKIPFGKFIREDLALRREIEVKQNWIKNSAHLSAAAPWILLLLLSTQPATSAAFSTATGIFILCVGLGLTALAYLWMNSLSRIPSPNRIFTSNLDGGRA